MKNYSHILTITTEYQYKLINEIHDKEFNFTITNDGIEMKCPIKWEYIQKKNCYHTDANGMFGDVVVQKHTKYLIEYLKAKLNISIEFELSKPLTTKLCLI